LNANGLEYKLRAQQCMALHVVTISSIMAAKTLIFYDRKSELRF